MSYMTRTEVQWKPKLPATQHRADPGPPASSTDTLRYIVDILGKSQVPLKGLL